ncbi:glycosyltransferase [Helicobacter sp. 12S02232-10]|uniref:glycosyltransferase n=1 Tax=Helicobacter sp. 12S02232-10 TaxID=1476197 RepID=UPI000BA766EE|nr:glycosyltransferase [Helicobacter sp. 12S02232-10]
MKIKIFCEAGKNQGLGHLMRCYRLKKMLLDLGYQALIYQSGEENSSLSDFHCKWLDEDKIENLLQETDVAIIDSYEATEHIYQKIMALVKKLIILDDNNRIPYPKNAIILNGALGAQTLYPKTPNHLAGIEFLIFDKIFFCEKTPKPQVQDILITFGGTDPLNITERVITIIKDKPYIFHIVSRESLKVLKSQKIKPYHNISPSQMADLMQKCDIAISAGGGTLNELAMSQVPTLVIPTAPNQIFQAKNWEKTGAMKITSFQDILRDLDTIVPMKKREKMILKYKNIPFGKLLSNKLQSILRETKE